MPRDATIPPFVSNLRRDHEGALVVSSTGGVRDVALRDVLTEKRSRTIAAGIGLTMVAFGALPAVAPGVFARVFGFAEPDAPGGAMMRSLGARDVVMGIGLWSAAVHGGRYLPLVLARALTDGSDTLAVGLAVVQGKRDPRFISLGVLAAGAAVMEVSLCAAVRAAQSGQRAKGAES